MPIEAAGLVKFSATKMKDAEKPSPLEFKLEEAIYAEVEGDKVGSLVPVKMSDDWNEVLSTPKSGVIVTVGWMLERMVGQYMLTKNQLIEEHGLTSDAAKKALRLIQELGYAEKDGENSNARLRISEAGKRLMSRAGRSMGKDLDAHNGHAAPDEEGEA